MILFLETGSERPMSKKDMSLVWPWETEKQRTGGAPEHLPLDQAPAAKEELKTSLQDQTEGPLLQHPVSHSGRQALFKN